jgi:coenzyme F420-reducing hydrogenase beta subunit
MIHINNKHDCCGCTACASVCNKNAIIMQADKEGFLYPHVNIELCTDCHLCEKICPIITRDNKKTVLNLPLNVYALHHKDIEVWYKSSSGGVFTALAEDCLKMKGIVYGAVFSKDFTVVHCGEQTAKGILKFRGSKYVQSDIQGIYRDIRRHLRNERQVLFSGTPCQVEGLKNFLSKEYNNLTTIDILCHGVPSPRLFADYIQYINQHSIDSLQQIFMKDKTFGWEYQNLRLYYKHNNTEFNTPLSNLWNKLYYDNIINRPSCHHCRFTNLYRAGDITIGDFWGIQKSHPNFFNTNGISLLMVNTNRGKVVWERIHSDFIYQQSNTKQCLQPVLLHPKSASPQRDAFWKEYLQNGFTATVNKYYGITHKTLLKNKIQQLINLIRQK